MAVLPLSWNDSIFSGVTASGPTVVKDGGVLSNRSITDSSGATSIVGIGSFTLDTVRVSSREAVRIGGGGDITINSSYIETTGQAGDHADGIQAYSPGSSGNLTINNSTIVSHSQNATAGLFIADNYGGSVTLNNVVFEGGPFGLRIAADNQDITVSMKDVYFVGPFNYDPLLLQEVNAAIHITQWENVRYATIVNGQLVPGALIAAPFPVEGGTTTPPPVQDLVADISSWSPDSGKTGDGVTNSDKITLKGTATAGSTIKVLDGNKVVGTSTADANGNWSLTSGALADGTHKFTVTATNSSGTSPASAARSVVIDTAAPNAPTVAVSTSAAALAASHVAVLTGSAEANSTVKVYDGTTQIGTAATGSNGAWTFTTGNLATGSHSFTAKAMDAAGNTSGASPVVPVTISTPTTPPTSPKPDAPTITSFSEDSGVQGDGITNDNKITLTGSAAANSTVKIYDGSTEIGTAKAAANGSWSYITSVLTDAKHTLTAIATNSSGQNSSASAAVAITVDTKAPDAPSISTNMSGSARTTAASAQSASVASGAPVNLKGVAEAKSSVAIFDGNTKIGTVTAGSDGAWVFSTSSLSAGQHTLTAKATDAAGNVGVTSAAVIVSVTGSAPVPSAPKIASFSNDTGKVGDGITSDNTLKLDGTAVGNSTITIYDGAQKLGTVKSDSSGTWTFTTAALTDGSHSLTARVTDSSGDTGAASTATKVTIDTHAPNAPSLGVFTADGKALNGPTTVADVTLKGTAEANSLIKLFDAGKLIGEASAKSDGTWSFNPGHLSNGDHKFAAVASDAAGNTGAVSAAKAISVYDAPASSEGIDLTNVYQSSNSSVVIRGTADAYSQIKIFDGTKEMGSVKANSEGDWSYSAGSTSQSYVHIFSAKEYDKSGQVVSNSGSAIIGTAGADRLTGTSGDDIFIGNGHSDTFVFAPNFGNDTIKDFRASGSTHDTVQFSKSMFDNFADVLSHATQSGQDVVIASGHDTLTLKNTKIGALDKADFHFV